MERLRIGELLVQANLITPERLDSALAIQRAQGRKLGQVLIDLGIVNETQLTQALGRQLSVPWVSLQHVEFSRLLLDLVPRAIAERYCLVPVFVRRVRKEGQTLYVAMDDPTQDAAIEEVRASSSLPVRSMIAAPSEIRAAIRVYYETGEPPPEPVASSQPGAPPMTVRSGSSEAPPPPPSDPAPVPTVVSPDALARTAEIVAEAAPATTVQPTPPEAPTGDAPGAPPEVETSVVEVPRRKEGPPMVSLTLLDGTTIQVPAKPRRRREDLGREAASSPTLLSKMTARDLIKALGAVADGADPRATFGDRVPVEAICAAILALLLKKGLVADWEFVDELRRKR